MRLATGDVFAVPQRLSSGRNKKMIRCPGGDVAACAPYGSAIPVPNSNLLQGAAVVPGTDDLLLFTDTHGFRYDTATGASTAPSFDPQTTPSLDQVRHLRIR